MKINSAKKKFVCFLVIADRNRKTPTSVFRGISEVSQLLSLAEQVKMKTGEIIIYNYYLLK